MLTFILCLLAIFLFWLFGHLLGFCIYLLVLFIGHLISYWFLYVPLLALLGLAITIGINQLFTLIALVAIIVVLLIIVLLMSLRQSDSTKKPDR